MFPGVLFFYLCYFQTISPRRRTKLSSVSLAIAVLGHFFQRQDTCPVMEYEGWASKEAASDLEKQQRFYLGQMINRAPGCRLIESSARDLIPLR